MEKNPGVRHAGTRTVRAPDDRPTYKALGVKYDRAIRMQQAGLVPREDREAYYQAQGESDDFHALIATGHENPRRLARAFCATARV